jgi:hypothetical protein
VKKLQGICAGFFPPTSPADNLDIVVAIKPGGQCRVWFLSSRAGGPGKSMDDLRAKLEAVAVPKLSRGPIAFAINGAISGGVPSERKEPTLPIPEEWKAALSKGDGPMNFDQTLGLVWPDPAPVANVKSSFDYPPQGFVTQTLEPTGGKIFRPKEWFYSEDHQGSVYRWTLSKENPADHHPFTTGVSIQTHVGIKERSKNQSAQEFIQAFVAEKTAKASKLFKNCPEEDQGLFTRTGLELESGTDHILYSLFWGNNGLDVAVVSEARTRKELWKTFAPTFDQMSAFDLIDMRRLASGEQFKVPEGIRYKEASKAINEKARELIAKHFSAEANKADILALFSNKVICGPGLWRSLKQNPAMAALPKGKVNIQVGSQHLEGKLFQSNGEVLQFWEALKTNLEFGNFKVRRLNPRELAAFWAVISFDIEEPVFVLDSPRHKILVNFVNNNGLKIFWIDDLQEAGASK